LEEKAEDEKEHEENSDTSQLRLEFLDIGAEPTAIHVEDVDVRDNEEARSPLELKMPASAS
jgi:hypothetical protein